MEKTANYFNIILFLFLIIEPASAINPDDISGTWKTQDGKYLIRIERVGEFYQGRIVWHDVKTMEAGKPILDSQNPDERLRLHPLRGTRILGELAYNTESGNWTNGIHYNPETGEIFHCDANLRQNGD
ncbi:MAG: DUF2147 domain-containing protein, partial [Cyclobacteriaceae bacterium]